MMRLGIMNRRWWRTWLKNKYNKESIHHLARIIDRACERAFYRGVSYGAQTDKDFGY